MLEGIVWGLDGIKKSIIEETVSTPI